MTNSDDFNRTPDFFSGEPQPDNSFGIARPERAEDHVVRDSRGRPKILPLGKKMPSTEKARIAACRSYYRPSSFAEVLEDHWNLERWSERMIVNGIMRERHLQLEYANIGETELDYESKQAANQVLSKAKDAARASIKALEGTGLHALTERYDLGLDIPFVPADFVGNLEDWKRLTEPFEILDVECFVVEDEFRLAGTFDRLVRYHKPCHLCGARNRVLDLKSGSIEWGGMKIAAQLAAYAHGKRYNPATGERTPLDDVCTCRGLVVHIPSGSEKGTGVIKWVNIGLAWEGVIPLAAQVRKIRRKAAWWLEFEPEPDIMSMIQDCTTREELNGLFAAFKEHWIPAYTEAGFRRVEEFENVEN